MKQFALGNVNWHICSVIVIHMTSLVKADMWYPLPPFSYAKNVLNKFDINVFWIEGLILMTRVAKNLDSDQKWCTKERSLFLCVYAIPEKYRNKK